MNIVATVRSITNGFIVEYEGLEYFLPNFDINKFLINASVDHEAELKRIVLSFSAGSGKIPPIKAVREYCIKNNYDKCRGLKDAKDYVESLQSDDYWRGYRL